MDATRTTTASETLAPGEYAYLAHRVDHLLSLGFDDESAHIRIGIRGEMLGIADAQIVLGTRLADAPKPPEVGPFAQAKAGLAMFESAWDVFESTCDAAQADRWLDDADLAEIIKAATAAYKTAQSEAIERIADAMMLEGPAGNRREDIVFLLRHGSGLAWIRKVVGK